jgi:gamma-glutamyltranspeptidase/glutathione hydrolase
MNVQAAVDAPRTHMQWLPDEIQYEPGAIDDATKDGLMAMGYHFREIESWGCAQAIVLSDPKTGELAGASDRRRPSDAALGWQR